MAMGVRMGAALVLVAAVVALLLAQCVDRTEAGVGSEHTATGPMREILVGGVSWWREADEELFVDEPTRRMLASREVRISYGALDKNRSPCPAGRGHSYYNKNCKATNQNPQPYRRSCTAQGRCMRG